MDNSKESLKQILSDNKITLGRIALLEHFACPIVSGDVSSSSENMLAIWLINQPYNELTKLTREEALAKALEWIDAKGYDFYLKQLLTLTDGILEFYRALPKPEASQKKINQDEEMV